MALFLCLSLAVNVKTRKSRRCHFPFPFSLFPLSSFLFRPRSGTDDRRSALPLGTPSVGVPSCSLSHRSHFAPSLTMRTYQSLRLPSRLQDCFPESQPHPSSEKLSLISTNFKEGLQLKLGTRSRPSSQNWNRNSYHSQLQPLEPLPWIRPFFASFSSLSGR